MTLAIIAFVVGIWIGVGTCYTGFLFSVAAQHSACNPRESLAVMLTVFMGTTLAWPWAMVVVHRGSGVIFRIRLKHYG